MCDRPVPCRYCKQDPEVVEIAGMFYVKCYKCGALELALREETAVNNWNEWNKENGKRTLTIAPKCYSRRSDGEIQD